MRKYTRFEIARILGARTLQLSMGAPMLIKLSEEQLREINYDPARIARMEFEKGLLPFKVKSNAV
ncbi:MAG: DNA-directed polymerase subunit [Candidatus Woesearchaeota archaeon]|nr:DNA-directed polymerase subunit [Candidatus Woesearchaeota archaeon]MDN5327665.1 DNA-directed polymerase subunit [Candidatus Woesearchaeota archaeon]